MISWCIKEEDVPPWDISAVISDIQSLSCDGAFVFSAVIRSGNQVANSVANFCRGSGSWSHNLCCVRPRLRALVLKDFVPVL